MRCLRNLILIHYNLTKSCAGKSRRPGRFPCWHDLAGIKGRNSQKTVSKGDEYGIFSGGRDGRGHRGGHPPGPVRTAPCLGRRQRAAPPRCWWSPPARRRAGLALPAACRTVLLPGDAGGMPDGLRGGQRGELWRLAQKSLTVSSREGITSGAALQRELVTVDGQVVERQEFSMPLLPGQGELPSLAVAGRCCCWASRLRSGAPHLRKTADQGRGRTGGAAKEAQEKTCISTPFLRILTVSTQLKLQEAF